tara:strand:+ start:2001 stop:2645 length:645 start_codon:yes stop_codon:yes gene_type:complete
MFDPCLSIFIPYVKTTNKDYIANVFNLQNIGTVYQIDFNKTESGNYYCFIYLEWNNNIITKNIQERIHTTNDARIIYDEPKYWILKKNTSKNNVKGFNNLRIHHLFNENQKLKQEIDDLRLDLNYFLKNQELNQTMDYFECSSDEYTNTSKEYINTSNECTSLSDEHDDYDDYFTRLWDLEEAQNQNETNWRGEDYNINELQLKRQGNMMNIHD